MLIFINPLEPLYSQTPFSGGSGTPENPYLISNPEDLNQIRNYLGANNSHLNFRQTANIDLGVEPWNQNSGWEPIGSILNKFTATYYGGSYYIQNLTINLPNSDYIGLFGYIERASLNNLALDNINITGREKVGGLVGQLDASSIRNSYTNGVVNSNAGRTGGLAGVANIESIINDSHSTANISALGERVGGLIGSAQQSIINKSYASGSVTGSSDFAGGLIGRAFNFVNISESFASGNVSAFNNVGGLIGEARRGTNINKSYATGNVTGNNQVGGLVGRQERTANDSFDTGARIRDSYATGTVNGNQIIGGFIGRNQGLNYRIEKCYSTGKVSGNSFAGGFAGYVDNPNNLAYNYWDIDSSDYLTSVAGIPKTSAQMIKQSSFISWDFNQIWQIDEDITYPYHKWQGSAGQHNILGSSDPISEDEEVNNEELNALIIIAEEKLNQYPEGESSGQASAQTRNTLQNAINAAKAVMEDTDNQSQEISDHAKDLLEIAIAIFEAEIIRDEQPVESNQPDPTEDIPDINDEENEENEEDEENNENNENDEHSNKDTNGNSNENSQENNNTSAGEKADTNLKEFRMAIGNVSDDEAVIADMDYIDIFSDEDTSLILDDGAFEIIIPAHTLDSGAKLKAARILPGEMISSGSSLIQIGNYQYKINIIDKEGNPVRKFSNDLIIKVKYEDKEITNEEAQKLKIFYWEQDTILGNGTWIALPSSIDAENNTLIGKTNHLSKFALMLAPKFPSLKDCQEHWALPEIKKIVSLNIATGEPDGNFRPDDKISREEFITMLMKASYPNANGTSHNNINLMYNTDNKSQKIKDSAEISDWAKPFIATAWTQEIISGYEDSTIRPKSNITRAEMAVLLNKALNLQTIDKFELKFKDNKDIPDWAIYSLAQIAEKQIIKGYPDGSFRPRTNVTRAETAVILANLKHGDVLFASFSSTGGSTGTFFLLPF